MTLFSMGLVTSWEYNTSPLLLKGEELGCEKERDNPNKFHISSKLSTSSRKDLFVCLLETFLIFNSLGHIAIRETLTVKKS